MGPERLEGAAINHSNMHMQALCISFVVISHSSPRMASPTPQAAVVVKLTWIMAPQCAPPAICNMHMAHSSVKHVKHVLALGSVLLHVLDLSIGSLFVAHWPGRHAAVGCAAAADQLVLGDETGAEATGHTCKDGWARQWCRAAAQRTWHSGL